VMEARQLGLQQKSVICEGEVDSGIFLTH
jgi:hypothetical protein